MKKQLTSVQQDAVSALYARLKRVPPCTAAYDDIDHAIGLALRANRSSPAPALLARSAVRDARRIRTRREAKYAVQFFPENYEDVLAGGGPTPEDEVSARELEEQVRHAVRGLHPDALRYLETLLSESMGAVGHLGLRSHRVKYVRNRARRAGLLGELEDTIRKGFFADADDATGYAEERDARKGPPPEDKPQRRARRLPVAPHRAGGAEPEPGGVE